MPLALSTTSMPWAKACLPPPTTLERSRNRAGIFPVSGPLFMVATSLPLACLTDEAPPAALKPSTAPAFLAKLIAAIDVPPRDRTTATMDRISEGEGRLRISAPPR